MEDCVASQEEWLAANSFAKKKESTRLRDRPSAERRETPWVKVDK